MMFQIATHGDSEVLKGGRANIHEQIVSPVRIRRTLVRHSFDTLHTVPLELHHTAVEIRVLGDQIHKQFIDLSISGRIIFCEADWE